MLEPLHPRDAPTSALDALVATAPWDRAPADRPLVLVNMVSSLDGHVTVDGGSTGLGGDGDQEMFHALRTVVDAVLSGTGTIRAETYGRLVRDAGRRARRAELGLAGDPLAIVLTRSGNVPWEAPLFDAPEQPVAVVCAPGAVEVPARVRARVDVLELEDPSPAAALAALRRSHGLRTVLCEGGPTLNRSLVAAGLADELFLTLAPVLAGGEADALRVLGGEPLEAPVRATLLWALRHGDELLLRYSLAPCASREPMP